ncbi:unnamed protein product (macronuclear) [Paramecium tetraurelia]|uniref:Uncharacterized protein n=1 Tax=Paramecium tetraurelia TaxID=5888 RepID=A0CMN8_PARTE|nr:uncharacterized protein GSPATT00008534001 [Paramecium tetraurelia]CAK72055.1 unnamed protein product [Paramecium tetraurelia]|eukprot:XP_001439452.1 hypothetical protein (macronuclear) [Paramecium tetraurelia strain d4-2]
MFNNFKRNMRILNKDMVETSWLKCLIDDIPKQKHILILSRCLDGELNNLSSQEALKKIILRMQHPQKTITALKSYYLVHVLRQFLGPYVTDKTIELSQKSAADAVLQSVAFLYCSYLKNFSNNYEQINILYKMHRQLEVLILKLDVPIVKCITIKLIIDIIFLYESLNKQDDQAQRIRAIKQIKRFLEIRKLLELPDELLYKLNTLNFNEIDQKITFQIQPIENNYFENKPKVPHREALKLDMKCINQRKLSTSANDWEDQSEFQIQQQQFHKSLQPSPNRRRTASQTPNRTTSIRDNFFIPSQGPLSFIMMS